MLTLLTELLIIKWTTQYLWIYNNFNVLSKSVYWSLNKQPNIHRYVIILMYYLSELFNWQHHGIAFVNYFHCINLSLFLILVLLLFPIFIIYYAAFYYSITLVLLVLLINRLIKCYWVARLMPKRQSEVTGGDKEIASPFSCSPVNLEYLWKKNSEEKKSKMNDVGIHFIN